MTMKWNLEDLLFLLSSSVVSFLGVKRQRLIFCPHHSIRSGADLYEVFLNYIYCFGQDFHKLRSQFNGYRA